MDPFREVRDKAFDKLLETQREEYKGTLEPFEAYAARMKAQLHSSCDQYLEHLQHGYDSIINKIASKLKPRHK